MKTGRVVGEFGDVIKIWVNYFHFGGKFVNFFGGWWNCQFYLLSRWKWQIRPLVPIVSRTLYNQAHFSPTTVDEFTHLRTVCFLHPHSIKSNNAWNSPIELLLDRSIWVITTSAQPFNIQIRHHCDTCEQGLSFIITHVLKHKFVSHLLPTVRVSFVPVILTHPKFHDCTVHNIHLATWP